MYRFSRAIYRELAGDIIEEPRSGRSNANHARVLHACEDAMQRLATDRHYFAHPARTLFHDIRAYLPVRAQARALRVVECYLELADEHLRRRPQNGLDVCGNRLHCRASTRKGTPCKRVPLSDNGYCTSHQHLAETETEELTPLAA